jgi:transcription termination/antitermination protein NusA
MGMFKNLNREIEQIEKDKGIKKDVLIKALESAMLSAAKKKYNPLKDIEARFNEEAGEIELFEFKTVVEKIHNPEIEIGVGEARKHDPDVQIGDSLGLKMDTSDFGRIAAQTAKQVIIQKVRDAESDIVFTEYKDKKNEIIAGIVRRFEKGNIFIDLGRAEAILPVSHQVLREHYRVGDRIQVYIVDIQKGMKDAQIVVSRTDPGLLAKLFEMEVPEIYEAIVKIESAAREPGSRSKIAVWSKDSDIDAVGACVGIKGARVQSVVQELRGEKIDIVAYDRDPAKYVCNAIAPAEVSKVAIDEDKKSIELIVPDDQLSLAIGKKGQNVRLAAKLTGWRIDIYSETRIKEIAEEAKRRFKMIEGITDQQAEMLYNQGIDSLEEFIETDSEDIAQIGIPADKIESLKELARALDEKLDKEASEKKTAAETQQTDKAG